MSESAERFRLIQEDYLDDPWRLLVVCLLLNRTQGKQVRPILDELFERWPTPADLTFAERRDLEPLLAPLGFVHKRAVALRRLSAQWTKFDPETGDVRKLYGCGQYAHDAWTLLVTGNLNIDPADKELARYVADRREQ